MAGAPADIARKMIRSLQLRGGTRGEVSIKTVYGVKAIGDDINPLLTSSGVIPWLHSPFAPAPSKATGCCK